MAASRAACQTIPCCCPVSACRSTTTCRAGCPSQVCSSHPATVTCACAWFPIALHPDMLSRLAIQGGVVQPEIGHLRPQTLLHALATWFHRLHGSWIHADGDHLVQQSTGWAVAPTDGRSLPCRDLRSAAGVGTPPLLARLGYTSDISPEYGPVIAVTPDAPTSRPSSILVNTCGIVPQDDGQIWVNGIRAPHVGPDTSRWATGALVHMVQTLLGTHVTVTRIWEGYRPRRPKAPTIGPVPGYPHLWVASGHGGNGMLLAPVTAQIIRTHLTTAA